MGAFDDLTGFREELAKIVKPGNIVSETAVLEKYSRDYSFVTPGRPLLLVYPGTKDEVKGIVRLANESKMPLVPVSSGPPRFRGDTVPSQSGTIVDFSRMKRIIKIDALNRCAMIEPGVTYGELIPEVRKQGLKLNIPLLPRASKSVVTGCLEREPVLIPKYQYDYMDPLLTLEVIYGTGDEFRTGSASGPGDMEHLKSDKVNPWGPGSIDYYRFVSGAQGTMGLVTWATVKAEVLPSIQKVYFVPVADAREATTLMISLLKKRVVDECLALNNVNLAAILAEDWPGDYKILKNDLPPWTVITCIAGYRRRPEERVEIQEKYLIDICDGLGIKPQSDLPGAGRMDKSILDLLSNPWDKEPYWKLRYKGACHDIFFLTPLSKAGEFVGLMRSIAARYHYQFDDIGCYIQPMVQGRGCHCEFNLPCDESNAGEAAEVRKLFLEASEIFMKNGAFFSRPYGPWADMVYSRYTEGVVALKKLKNIFDPNNILNPGKLCF
jgi:FAD/FMN-containing dehydrogenase